MYVNLSWDLFTIVFIALIVAYSFIIGKVESVKLIIATYVAVVAVQGLGNLLTLGSGYAQPLLSRMGTSIDPAFLATFKLILFVASVIFLGSKGGMAVAYTKEESSIVNIALTGILGIATAGLLLSTLITYIAGVPLLDIQLGQAQAIAPLVQQSEIIRAIVRFQDLWFSFPALLLLVLGFLDNRE